MKKGSFIRFCRSMLALVLALMLPLNSFAAVVAQPNLLTAIEAQAFMNNTAIKEAVFPESLKTIGSQAFSGCSALTKAIIPATVEEIAADAFEGLQGQLTIETVKGCYAWDWAKENGFKVYDPNIAFDVTFNHYFSTLYLDGNVPDTDVAYIEVSGELEEDETVEWNVKNISGQDCMDIYLHINEDGQSAYVMAENIAALGESVWKATAVLPNGEEWAQEFSMKVENLPENLPTELDVDYPFRGEVGERFEFKPSERIRNLDAFPDNGNEKLCNISYYFEIWDDPTHEFVEDGHYGAFAFTPSKSGRYGISLYYYIGNHVIEHHGIIFIGDGTTDENKLVSRLPDTIYTDASEEVWLGNVTLERFHLLPDEVVEWNVELLGETDETKAPVVYISDYFDGTNGANFHVSELNGRTGNFIYRITAEVSGSVFTYDYELNVLETPAGLPTAIEVPQTAYKVAVGDTLKLLTEDIRFADGIVPEGAYVFQDYWDLHYMEGEQEVEWLEEGISVHFVQDGRYQINAVKFLAGIEYNLPITIIVGSGAPQNVAIHEQMNMIFDTQYINYENINWVGDFELRDYQLLEGEELTWKIEQVDETGINPGVIEVDNVWDNGLCAGVHMYDFTGETGVTTWRLTVASSMGYSWSKEYQIETVEMPENLPTEITEPEEVIYLEAGETYHVSRDDIRLGGSVPENAKVWFDLMPDELGDLSSFEWKDNGFEVTLTENGRYIYHIGATINGVEELFKRITVIVGNGISENAHMSWFMPFESYYINNDQNPWLADAYVENYTLLQDEAVEWKIECLSGEGIAELYQDFTWDDDLGSCFRLRNFTGETGEVTYRITSRIGDFVQTCEGTFRVEEMPDNLPSDIWLENEEIHLDIGEHLNVRKSDIFFTDDGVVPEDASIFKDLYTDQFNWQENFEWVDDGFDVVFHEDGRYTFEAVASINGVDYLKEIPIIVGTGIPADAWLECNVTERTVYTNMDTCIWAFGAHVNDYFRLPDEQFCWNLEQLSEGEPVAVVERGEDENWMGIHYNLLPTGEATGTVVYRLTLETSSGFKASQDFTIHVVDLPENFPTDISVPQTEYHLEVGETFTFTDEGIEPVDGEVAESDWINISFPGLENGIEQQESFRWLDDVNGFEVTFDQNGRYGFEVHYWINNFLHTKPITIIVGTGVPENAELALYQQLYTAYLGADNDAYVGNVTLEGYRLLNGEGYDWWLELVDAPEDHMPIVLEAADEYDNGNGINIHAHDLNNGTGTFTYRLHFSCESGLELYQDITVNVVEMPENMPTAIEVPQTYYEVNVGETLEFLFEDIVLLNGEISEGMEAHKTYHIDEGWLPGTEWMEDKVSIRFENDGQYEIVAAAEFGNYIVRQSIFITVGTGIPEDAWVEYWGTERTVYTNSEHQNWAFDAYVHNYFRLSDEEFVWKLEKVSEGEPVALVERGEAGDNWLGVAYDLLPTGEATGTVVYRLTLETGSGFKDSQDFTIHVVELPENFPSDIVVPEMQYHLQADEKLVLLTEEIGPADGEVNETDWISIGFPGIENGIEQQESFHWLEEGGFEVSFQQDGRYFFEVHYWINNFLFAKPIEIIVGSGVSQNAGIEERVFFEKQYINHDGVNWVGDLNLVEYRPLEGEELTWAITRIDENDIEPGRVEIDAYWDENCGAGLHLYDFSGETGLTTWRVDVHSSMGYSWSKEFDIEFLEMPETLLLEIVHPESMIYLDAGETYYAFAEDVRLANEEFPEDAELLMDVYPNELEGYHTFNWLDRGFEVTFTEDGRYGYTVNATINGIELYKDVILVVGSGIAENVCMSMTIPFGIHYINDQEQWLADAYLENFMLSDEEEVQWTIECLDETPVAEVFLGTTWNGGLGAGFRMNNFTGVPSTLNYRITAWFNGEPIRVYEDSVLVEEMPDHLPSGIYMEQEELHLQQGETLSVHVDDIFFTDDGIIPEGNTIYKEFDPYPLNEHESFEWFDGGFNVTLPNGRYAFQALAMINGIEYIKEIRVIVGNGESETAWLNVWHALNKVYVGGDDTWNGNAYLEEFTLFDGETVVWSLEPENPDAEQIAELYIDENGCWDQGLGINYHVRNVVSAGEISYVLTAELPNGQVMSENLILYVEEMPDNLPTELTVPQDRFVLKCGERLVLWTDEFGFSDGELPEDAPTMYDVFFDDTIQHFEWFVEDDREGIWIQFDQLGDTVIEAVGWIGNICLTKSIQVSVVDPSAENVVELWVAEGVFEFTKEKVQQFKESNEQYAGLTVLVRSVSEGDAADAVFEDTDNSGDMFVFAQDQLARLVAASKLEAVSEANAAVIAAANDEGAVNAVQFGGTSYAYPVTSDNGYFLYYDKNVVSDPSALEEIIADCEEAGKFLGMDLSSGWYQPAFFFGAGCTLEYDYDENANLTSCTVDYASENGVRALKAMMKLAESPAFVNASECNDMENIGALVSGAWNANLMEQKLGSGYAAAKLPTVDGFQMSGFGGYKMLGIKPQVSEAKKAVCEALAMYLTSAEVQAERYEVAQWGPSNLQVQQSEAVKNNLALSALADQLQYCVPQGQYPDEYWSLAEKLGVRLIAGDFGDMDDAELLNVLTDFQNQAEALVR